MCINDAFTVPYLLIALCKTGSWKAKQPYTECPVTICWYSWVQKCHMNVWTARTTLVTFMPLERHKTLLYSPHFSRHTTEYLNKQFTNSWIGRGGQQNWPQRSPDLTPPTILFVGLNEKRGIWMKIKQKPKYIIAFYIMQDEVMVLGCVLRKVYIILNFCLQPRNRLEYNLCLYDISEWKWPEE